jgi:DNA-binding transcriptional MerR regulator
MKKVIALTLGLSVFSSFAFSREDFNSLSGRYFEVPGSEKMYVSVKELKGNKLLSRVRIDKTFADYGYEVEEINEALILENQRSGKKEIVVSHNIFPVLPIIQNYRPQSLSRSFLERIDEAKFVSLLVEKKKQISPKISVHEGENLKLGLSNNLLADSLGFSLNVSSCDSYKVSSAQKISYLKDHDLHRKVQSSEKLIYTLESRLSEGRSEKCLGKLLKELKLKLLLAQLGAELDGVNIIEDALIAATLSQPNNFRPSGIQVLDPLNFKERNSKTAKVLEIERIIDLEKR